MKSATSALVLACALAAAWPALADPAFDAARADAAVRAFVAKHGIPAAHVTVLHGDRVVFERGYGGVNASSIFPLGSISKQFTAATALSLVEAGKLRLDAPVGEYLPEWFADEPALRVSHLLAQTSGLADFLWLDGYRALGEDAATPIAAYVALGAAAPRRFAPGTRWGYSNTNYKALALIVERVDGRPYDRVLDERVLGPAGIEGIASCHALPGSRLVPGVDAAGAPRPLDASANAYVGDGGLCGGAAALVRWIRTVLATPDEPPARLARGTVLADGTQVPYGFGVSTRPFLGHAMVWHGGNVDSHSTMIAYLPDRDLGVVVLTARGNVWLTELLPALLGDAAGAPTQDREARRAGMPPPPAGRFEDGLFGYDLVPGADGLRVTIDLIGAFDFVPDGTGDWVARELPSTFRIRLPADGAGDRFEFEWSELRSYAVRVTE